MGIIGTICYYTYSFSLKNFNTPTSKTPYEKTIRMNKGIINGNQNMFWKYMLWLT